MSEGASVQEVRIMDLMEELDRLDRFLEGKEKGDVPIEVLRANRVDLPAAASLDDEAIHVKLWEVLEAMSEIGLVMYFTDHLSDRDLYRFLVEDALLVEEILSPGGNSFCHISPIGGCSEEDNEIYLRYYADDEVREEWQRDFKDPLPPKERPPFDRDRFLPGR